MTTLHAFGCSITQGFALPDTIQPVLNEQGQPYTTEEIRRLGIKIRWEDIHLYQPSQYAWPQVLADSLGVTVVNHARRGACFQQIARQCAVAAGDIQPDDIIIVMWTYLSRLSFQWPARTSVPFANIVDSSSWRTRILPGFNRFFGLSNSNPDQQAADQEIYEYIHRSAVDTYLDPMGVYDQYYRSLILQTMTDGFLKNIGARVIHLSVEPESYIDQLEAARQALPESLREPYLIPNPSSWYGLSVDHDSAQIIHDPMIPPAENDMHPSITHHRNFAEHIRRQYFQ